MKEINISNDNGYIFSVYLVRYFRFKNNKYFIYTLQEKDDRDYMKLYVVKVMKELGNFVTQTIRRPDEWNQMKNIVKRILSEIKRNKLISIEDLNASELENIVVYESRSFRIASDLANNLAIEILPEILNVENSNNQAVDVTVNNIPQANETIEVLNLDEPPEFVEVLELDNDEVSESPEEEIEILEL